MTTKDGSKEWDTLMSVGNAPGYRDVSLNMLLSNGQEMELNLKASDALHLFESLRDRLRLAWQGGKPLDLEQGEPTYDRHRKELGL